MLISELLKQADQRISEGLHPRLITEGFDMAKDKCLEVLNKCKIELSSDMPERDTLLAVAGTSLRTKLHADLAGHLVEPIVDAVLAIRQPKEALDLHRIEIMELRHQTDMDPTLLKGLVMDHGGRHPDMPKRVTNAYILTCNVSLEYEKTYVCFFIVNICLVKSILDFSTKMPRRGTSLSRLNANSLISASKQLLS